MILVAWFSDGPGRSRSRTLSLTRLMDSRSCSWRHDALVLSAPIATLLRIGQKWHLRARYSKLYFLKFLISEKMLPWIWLAERTRASWPWMKSIRRGRERVRDRERPGPSKNQAMILDAGRNRSNSRKKTHNKNNSRSKEENKKSPPTYDRESNQGRTSVTFVLPADISLPPKITILGEVER